MQKSVIVTYCDLAHGTLEEPPAGARPVTITTPEGVWEIDVCAEHAAHFITPVIAGGRRVKWSRRRRAAADATT